MGAGRAVPVIVAVSQLANKDTGRLVAARDLAHEAILAAAAGVPALMDRVDAVYAPPSVLLKRERACIPQRCGHAFACLALLIHLVERMVREDQAPIGDRLLDAANYTTALHHRRLW